MILTLIICTREMGGNFMRWQLLPLAICWNKEFSQGLIRGSLLPSMAPIFLSFVCDYVSGLFRCMWALVSVIESERDTLVKEGEWWCGSAAEGRACGNCGCDVARE